MNSAEVGSEGETLGGEDARNAGEVVRYANVCPLVGVEKWLNRGQAVVAKFENEQAGRLEMLRRPGNQLGVKLVAFFAAVESEFGLVLTNFTRQAARTPATDVGRVADDEIKRECRVATGEWRESRKQICFLKVDASGESKPSGVLLRDLQGRGRNIGGIDCSGG